MKLVAITSILLLSSIVHLQGQSVVEQHILSKVNPHWSEIPLTNEQARQVRQASSYHELIQLHLEFVTGILTDGTASFAADEPTRQKRLALLDSLTDYYERSVFPINNKAPYPTPVFVDDIGTHCAVGYLLHASGYDDLVGQIANENNLAYVRELKQDYNELGVWAKQHGFSVEELAWIQPLYMFFCNEEITRGEIIHNTCYDDCNGAFYADHTTIDLPPDLGLSWGRTSKWHNGQWINISHPDCLCSGLYRQAFTVHSPQGDSLYSVFIEAEILSPDELYGYGRNVGEAGLCRAHIVPETYGGVAPYSYEVYDIDGNAYGLGPLCEGVYNFVIQDANGCQFEDPIQVYSPEEDCLAFSVNDLQMNNPTQDLLEVTIFIEGDSSSFVQIPIYAEVKDGAGTTMAWFADSLNQFGGTSQTYLFQTTMNPFPINSAVTLQLEFSYSLCQLPIPAITTTLELEELSMTLYPNPLEAEATVFFNEVLTNARLQIFNVQGQLVGTREIIESDAITIHRDQLPQGLYTLQVVAGDKTGAERFVIVD
jgi:hypothetical protein